MFLIGIVPRLLVFAFLITAMLSVGLQTTGNDLRHLLASKGFLFRCLLVNLAVVPAIGLLLVRSLPLTPEAAAAFLLLACTPGGISALQYSTRIKGSSLFAAGTSFVLSLGAVFISPLLLAVVLPGDIIAQPPYGRAVLFILLFMLLPLLGGAWGRRRWGNSAPKASILFAMFSAIFFIAVFVLVFSARKEAIHVVGGKELLFMLMFILLSMAAGWLLGGPAKETRTVLATVSGMRHAALCLLLAADMFPDAAVQTHIVAFSAVMIWPSTLFTGYMVLRFRKAAKAALNA